MNPKNLNWTTKKPKTIGSYWWKADNKDDAEVYEARVYSGYPGPNELGVCIIPNQIQDISYTTRLNLEGIFNFSGLWAKNECVQIIQATQNKNAVILKKEHRNSKLARRIKETQKVLKDFGYLSDIRLLRTIAENQLAIMERILEIDREKKIGDSYELQMRN